MKRRSPLSDPYAHVARLRSAGSTDASLVLAALCNGCLCMLAEAVTSEGLGYVHDQWLIAQRDSDIPPAMVEYVEGILTSLQLGIKSTANVEAET